ncbi:MAG: ATP-binding protein [Muribaculaceae bacterium]|nr:ATP-binding protein [Muribaculaceae bacterium]
MKTFLIFAKSFQFHPFERKLRMIIREHYIEKIRPFYDSDLIKIITGVRRCGKSVIKDQIEQELHEQGKRTLSLDFERLSVSSQIRTAEELEAFVLSHLSSEKTYVFLDEIQLVENWNLACRSLRLENLSLFITGSNSKLLSKELTKAFSGRYVSFNIRPFVYKEICEYAAETGNTRSVTDYLIYGGFPKTIEFPDKSSILTYLNELDEQIVRNDIINRYHVRKVALFEKLINYVLRSNSRIFSAHSVMKYLKGQGMQASVNTIMKYLNYLEEAYIIRSIPQYMTKAKRELMFFSKVYDEDVAFNTIRQSENRYDLTHNLENVVYNELVFMGYNLSVFRKDSQEIDFYATKNGKSYLVQVAYSIADDETYNREFALFNKLDQSMRKIIITNDDIDYSTSTVQHIMLKDFLGMNDLEG